MTSNVSTPPRWFRILAVIALIWNLLGLAAFASQMAMDTSALPEAQAAFYASIPWWATLGFAVAVLGGTAGCIALLLRKRVAVALFAASLVGLGLQNLHSLLLGDGLAVFGAAGLVLPALTCAISVALLLLARHAVANDWLS